MSSALGELRLLLLYDCLYPESLGGIEHRNLELARALAARGHRVTLAGFGDDATSPAPGVDRLALGPRRTLHDRHGRRRATAALAYAAATARLDLAGFDLVETASLPFGHLPPLALRCRVRGVPLVVTWYEYWGAYWRRYLGAPWWPLFALWERLSATLGGTAIATSRLTATRLAARRGGEVPVVPVGISTEAIAAAAAAGASGPPGAPLLYAGRLIPEKRLDLLLAAIARLADRPARPLLDLVGEGPDRPRLERLAGELGIADRVRFCGRLPAAMDVWRALGAAEIAVQPSAREGFGIFPLEALAAGRPVVICESSESAVGELVEDRRHGLAVAAEPEPLAAALSRLLDDEPERRRLGEAGRLQARRYEWTEIARRFEILVAPLVRSAR